MRVALVGQPNAGKSTLFNCVAGYRTLVANFPGTTVELSRSAVCCGGERFELVDVPGFYSVSGTSEEERRALADLLALGADVVVDVIDASLLGRSLELTIELLELGIPIVVCLNMMDEAGRKGIAIDAARLSAALGVPVVPAVASRGEGVPALFAAAIETAQEGRTGNAFPMSRDVETAVAALAARIDAATAAAARVPARALALRLIEGDETAQCPPGLAAATREARRALEEAHGRPADVVVSSERHALSMNLFERVAVVRSRPGRSARERADRVLLHPVAGAALLVLVLAAFFFLVFGLGGLVEPPVMALFARLSALVRGALGEGSLPGVLLVGIVQGFSGGVGIVLPYLVPFLAGLAVLEDVGYVPRAAFLVDALMHRIGLHGKAVIPFVLGYGCTVPAVMGVRIMESRRERRTAALLVNFIPCAARSTIVFALAGVMLGPWGALAFYAASLLVIAATGRLLAALRPEDSTGLILEIPPYRVPSPAAVARKVWFRLREFVVVAWPIIIAGSVALSLLEYARADAAVNGLLAPFTSGILGLPPETGITLLFGVLRKELTVVMLVQALGTSDFGSVLTASQAAVYTAFIVFYVPCLATVAMLRSTVGLRDAVAAVVLTTAAATAVAVIVRIGFLLAA